MSPVTSPIRQIEQSLAIHVRNGLSGAGWQAPIPSVYAEFPEAQRALPCVAIENDSIDSTPAEMGTKLCVNDYNFVIHVFANDKGQRADLVYSLIGDDDALGVLGKDLPVYEISGAYTGAFLFPCRMEHGPADMFSTGDDKMNKWRAAIRLSVSKR